PGAPAWPAGPAGPVGPVLPAGPCTFQLSGTSYAAEHLLRLSTIRIVPTCLSWHALMTVVVAELRDCAAKATPAPIANTPSTAKQTSGRRRICTEPPSALCPVPRRL